MVWDFQYNTVKHEFHGHKSEVTALLFIKR